MVFHPGGTETRLHRRRHRLAVATGEAEEELAQRESNKKGIAETGDGVTTQEKRNVSAIMSE